MMDREIHNSFGSAFSGGNNMDSGISSCLTSNSVPSSTYMLMTSCTSLGGGDVLVSLDKPGRTSKDTVQIHCAFLYQFISQHKEYDTRSAKLAISALL
jgi:hypothetical protein